jgi:hypothetical protein
LLHTQQGGQQPKNKINFCFSEVHAATRDLNHDHHHHQMQNLKKKQQQQQQQ